MRALTHHGPATEWARLTAHGARLYPGLLPGVWYDVVPGSADALGGMFLVVGNLERYVWRAEFHVERVGDSGPDGGQHLGGPGRGQGPLGGGDRVDRHGAAPGVGSAPR